MIDQQVILITGTRKGIGKHLAYRYANAGYTVIGCSRRAVDFELENYSHFCLDVADEQAVQQMFSEIRKSYGRLDILINNAGTASMNHFLLTPLPTVEKVMNTNFTGTFLMCRGAAKLMQKKRWGRIVNFSTVAVPFNLDGEAIYVASKAAVEALTKVLARELAEQGITVNAIGPTPIKTDLLRSVPEEKIDKLTQRQAIQRLGEFRDVVNVVDFFTRKESDFITGQIIYLGGV